MNFDGIDFLTTIVGIFFGSLVLSTVGFGIGIAGTPFMLLSMSAPEVVVVINTVSLFVFALLIRETRKSIECRQILFPTVLGVIGVPIGVYLLGIVDPRVLRIAMAFVIIICGSFAGWRKTSIPDSSSLFLPAAFLVGILLTVSGIGGPIMALLAVSKKWTQDTIRGSLSFYFLFVEGTAVVGYLIFGLLSKDLLVLVGVGIIPAIVGFILASHIVKGINESLYRSTVIVIIIVSGIVVLGKEMLWLP
tara:strand:- start:406 stop:1149 length:744 start_codon:yes stop_codon:yes gene_type:complete